MEEKGRGEEEDGVCGHLYLRAFCLFSLNLLLKLLNAVAFETI